MKYVIYCDGACKDNGTANARGSWAYVIINESEKKFIKESGSEMNSTNQRMELTAALMALRKFHSLSLQANEYELQVCTDSAYLFNCWHAKWYKDWKNNHWRNKQKKEVSNRDLWEELVKYFDDERIEFVKVKGHSNVYWNEFVDRLAQNI